MNEITLSTSRMPLDPEVLQTAISLWASTTTDADTSRRSDLLHDKTRAVSDFFGFVQKHPAEVTPQDVQQWLDRLNSSERAFSHSTVYAWASRVSSWYEWAKRDDRMSEVITYNPVDTARPKPPKAYNGAQSLSDDELTAILSAIPTDSPTGLRDRAMFLFYILTGHRREEVCRLTWENVRRNGALTVRFLNKGGDYKEEQVNILCYDALTAYLKASSRLDKMTADSPLWVGHDHSGTTGEALSSHSFAKNLKRYARLAGIEKIHLHQLRHSFGRLVAEETGDLGQVQTAMGHRNQATTRVYVQSIAVKKDNHSTAIASRLGLQK